MRGKDGGKLFYTFTMLDQISVGALMMNLLFQNIVNLEWMYLVVVQVNVH